MKLASLKRGRDGQLLLVSRDLARATDASHVVPTLQAALDDWDAAAPRLQEIADARETGRIAPSIHKNARRRCLARSSGPTARPTSTTWSCSARRGARRFPRRSGAIR